ncbi:MAG: hypothetical protein ABI340_08485 [Nitrososphaera sp.]|jgi:hypothetical protein
MLSAPEPDSLPFTDIEMDPSCWEEKQSNERGTRFFFVPPSYRGTPSITLHNHREKRKICFDKSITITVKKNQVFFDKKKIVHCP